MDASTNGTIYFVGPLHAFRLAKVASFQGVQCHSCAAVVLY